MKILNKIFINLNSIMCEKIDNVLCIGSLAKALEKDYIKYDEVLISLMKCEDYSPQDIITYKILCQYVLPREHYLNNGNHFLVEKPFLCFVALHYDNILNLPSIKNDDTSFKISHYTDSEDNEENPYTDFFNFLTYGSDDRLEVFTHLTLLFKARLYPI